MIRLIADDLTGALDAAAAFAGAGPVRVTLRGPGAFAGWHGGRAAVSGTRDLADPSARRKVAEAAAALLCGAGGGIAFCKIDSVLRGAPDIDIAACAAAIRPERIIVAPAFPAQGRVTRGGRQWRRDLALGGAWRRAGPPLDRLTPPQSGAARIWAAGTPLATGFPAGVHVCDATTDGELAAIATACRATPGWPEGVLLVGSAGLAAAVAPPAPRAAVPGGSVLMLFGTDHPVTRAQIAHLLDSGLAGPAQHVDPPGAAPAHAPPAMRDVALIDLSSVPAPQASRTAAAGAIGRALARLLRDRPAPGVLVAGGGATLAAALGCLHADALDVLGAPEPGVALSRIVGGAWAGVALVSKSGGFGDAGLLARLVTARGG